MLDNLNDNEKYGLGGGILVLISIIGFFLYKYYCKRTPNNQPLINDNLGYDNL